MTANGSGPASYGFISQRSRLHYVDWGNADAPTLLLIHGSRDHARSWDWVADALCADWHVVAVDLRGHGDSGWSSDGRYDFASYLYDMVRLVHELGGKPLYIIAHSLGAHISLRFAGLYPDMVDRLIAVEAVGPPLRSGITPPPPPPAADALRAWIGRKQEAASRSSRRYASLADATARMRAENARLSPEQARHLTRHGARRDEDGRWRWKFDNLLRVWPYPDVLEEDVDALLRAIRCPVMLIYGCESWVSDMPARLQALLPSAHRVEMEGAGHWPHHDCLATFIGEVRRFLGR